MVGWNIPETASWLAVDSSDAEDLATVSIPGMANSTQVRLEPHSTTMKVEPNDRQHPQPILLPVTITGRIDRPGHIDAYQFSARKGEKLSFQLESRGLGFPLDAVLRLTDDSGKLLIQGGTAAGRRVQTLDPTLAYTVGKDGTYRLEVSDLYGDGGMRHVYRLTAVRAEPAFALTLAIDHFEMAAGKPLNIPVTIDRRNGYDREIELSVEGLPEGVTVAPAKSMPTGATAKSVTLRLTAEAGPFSVPIQIVGKVPGHGRNRIATVVIPGFKTSTTNVWLTVPKAAPPAAQEPARAR
jgi:hypothetical protein